jgi:hypothetical protein
MSLVRHLRDDWLDGKSRSPRWILAPRRGDTAEGCSNHADLEELDLKNARSNLQGPAPIEPIHQDLSPAGDEPAHLRWDAEARLQHNRVCGLDTVDVDDDVEREALAIHERKASWTADRTRAIADGIDMDAALDAPSRAYPRSATSRDLPWPAARSQAVP